MRWLALALLLAAPASAEAQAWDPGEAAPEVVAHQATLQLQRDALAAEHDGIDLTALNVAQGFGVGVLGGGALACGIGLGGSLLDHGANTAAVDAYLGLTVGGLVAVVGGMLTILLAEADPALQRRRALERRIGVVEHGLVLDTSGLRIVF